MNSDDAVIAVIRALNVSQIPYIVTGSLASNLYGIARSTHDADFVVQADSRKLGAMLNALPPPLRLDPQMSFETITATTRHVVELVGSHFKIEFFNLSQDPHDIERFRRRCRGRMLEEDVWLPTPEDVIITKLLWSKRGKRTKDADDVRNILAVQGDALDWDYIHGWCETHETRELLDRIRDSIPEDL